MNKCIFMGRITADPELKTVGDDSSVVNFNIAINRPKRKDADHPEADFIPCTAWNKVAELISTYFGKGDRIVVCGPLQSRKYEDKEGNNRTAYNVRVDDFDFVETKNESNRAASSRYDDSDDELPV